MLVHCPMTMLIQLFFAFFFNSLAPYFANRDSASGLERPLKDVTKLRITSFSGIWKYPSRIKCASLSWHTMKGALENEKAVSTETE